MKINKLTVVLLLAALYSMTACSKDGDTIYTSGFQDLVLGGNEADIVLSIDALDALALTLYWNDNSEISLSDPRVDAPKNAIANTIQFSTSEDFGHVAEVAVGDGVFERQFSCKELNSVLTKLGFEPGVKAPLYIRVQGRLADNVEPSYSKVLVVQVTPYKVDTTVGRFFDSKKEDTGRILYAPADDRIYYGFIGAGAWENWFLNEADGTTWGNDGVTGMAFVMSSAGDAWNFWYPGISGCYYTTVDTHRNEWTALLVESLTVSGDVAGEMTYDRKANTWALHVDVPAPGSINVTLTGSGKLYNAATGTDDAAAIATQVGFSGDVNALTFNASGAGSTVTLDIPAAGETDLLLDLNNPKGWTLATGTAAPEEKPAEILWVVGHNDGITGSWLFDSWLRLYNEDNLTYGGVLNINSLWGYKLYKEQDNWDDFYGMVTGGNGYEGSLEANGTNNIAAPAAGLYVADVSLSGLTYKLTAVNSVHFAGLNDDWNLSPMTATAVPGVYTATVTKSADTPYGVKVIINEDWGIAFGGTSGYLRLYQDGFDGDNDLPNGTYILTVNLLDGTYAYE
ncbi:MAG: DUF5114 domain-containing protein [Parabacteroides sp.]|nr:DUF5114 domain-containing protein [Parabacteroides sp.]